MKGVRHGVALKVCLIGYHHDQQAAVDELLGSKWD